MSASEAAANGAGTPFAAGLPGRRRAVRLLTEPI